MTNEIKLQTDRLQKDLEQLAQENFRDRREIHGILRNYRDERRRHKGENLLFAEIFLRYHKNYAIVKNKIENRIYEEEEE